MERLIRTLFEPPPLPAIHLPMVAGRLPGVRESIASAFEFAYYRGVYDGFIAGSLLVVVLILMSQFFSSARRPR